jgi:hypothetical protein
MGEMAVNGETESGSRTWLSALLGTMTGLIVSAGFGITTMVATGLNMGTRIALDGTVQAVFEPLAAYPVGWSLSRLPRSSTWRESSGGRAL